ALAYRLTPPVATDRLLLAGGDAQVLDGWQVPVFPLKGGAVVARGVTAGPLVARILQEVEARWVAEGFPDAGRIDELLTEALGGGAFTPD
ncbi:MAG: polynucleotide adenylyltransferase, partial [Erythrobacter sp.]|nr:polynucleotide adenylyltransferase [Erythrobacter sp.]